MRQAESGTVVSIELSLCGMRSVLTADKCECVTLTLTHLQRVGQMRDFRLAKKDIRACVHTNVMYLAVV